MSTQLLLHFDREYGAVNFVRIRFEGSVMAKWLAHGPPLRMANVSLRCMRSETKTKDGLVKQIAHNWQLPCCQCMETCSYAFSVQNDIYSPVPGVSSPVVNLSCTARLTVFDSGWYHLFGANAFWWIDHGRMVSTLATAMDGKLSLWDARACKTTHHIMRQITHNWHLPCCQCPKTCFVSPSYHILCREGIDRMGSN